MPEPGAPSIDLTSPRRLHVVGVGGSGMSAIAAVLAGMGHTVSGSDLKASPVLDRLALAGVATSVGHRPGNVAGVDAVAASSAVPATNEELVEARRVGVPVLSRAQILAAMTATRRTVAVAGTHGKTTTTSMLALAMAEGGFRPSFIIGGDLNEVGTGAVWDAGEWMAVEADESDGTFLALEPEVAVVTSVEPDHLEHYGSFEALVDAFRRFLSKPAAARLACADYPVAAGLAAEVGAVTYGTAPGADWRIVEVEADSQGTSFDLEHAGSLLGPVRIPLLGVLNVRNATAALVASQAVGVDLASVRTALGRFAGVARRFQFRGRRDGVTYVDDYAHLPGEVGPVLEAAAQGGWDRIVCVFQPHRYSRTQSLWADFADAFTGADVLVVTDVYPAGEPPRPGVTGQLVADAVRTAHPGMDVSYVPSREDLVEQVAARLRPGDLCLTLGAGDLTTLPDDLLGRGER